MHVNQKNKLNNFKCCYPAAPLLEPIGNEGGYKEVGYAGCRSELFLHVDLIGTVSKTFPFKFTKINNVFQCALCGVFYRMENNRVYILLKDNWCPIDLKNYIITYDNGKRQKIIMDLNEKSVAESKALISEERKRHDLRMANKRKQFVNLNI